MQWQAAYLLSIVVTLILLAGVLAYAWRFRHARGALYFLLFCFGALVWTLMVGVAAVASAEAARLWILAKYFVIAFEPVPVLLFVLAYTGRERVLKAPFIAGACVVPAITQVIVWTNESHHLMLRSLETVETRNLTYISEITFGSWYWVHAFYGYLLILLSAGIIALFMFRGGALARRQGLPILAGVLTPLFANVLLVTGISPREIDPMPFGLALTAVLFGWGGFRYQLLNLVPVARSALVEAVKEGMLVLDAEGRIIDLNPAMAGFLGVEARRASGRLAGIVFEGRPELESLVNQGAELSVEDGAQEIRIGEREFEARILNLGSGGSQASGRLLVLSEQTQRKRMERERERLIGELREALAQVKNLKGMLPICASCKKVRDDEGYWHQVDVYIRDHSDAEITHGICPECQDALYPEYRKQV